MLSQSVQLRVAFSYQNRDSFKSQVTTAPHADAAFDQVSALILAVDVAAKAMKWTRLQPGWEAALEIFERAIRELGC